MRTALSDNDGADGRPAGGTGFAGALIYAVADLEKALSALGVHVVGDRRTSGGNGFGEHGDDGVVEFAGAVAADALGECLRMNAGAEKGLIGVDITDAAEEGLVEKQRLDARLVPLERDCELLEGNFERLGSKAGDTVGKVFAELDTAELPAIVIQEGGAVEGENGAGVRTGRATEQQGSPHAWGARPAATAPYG